MEDEYYFLLFLKRLKSADYQLAFAYYNQSSFPEKLNFSKSMIEGVQTLFANWILNEAVNCGAWRKQSFYIDGKISRTRFFEISTFRPYFTGEILYFFEDLLKLQSCGRQKDSIKLPKRPYSTGDRLIIHCFTRDLIRKGRKPMINSFQSALSSVGLNRALLEEPFLMDELKFSELSPEELIFFESSLDFLVQEVVEFNSTLHFYKQKARLERTRAIGKKLLALTGLVKEQSIWSLVRPLSEVFEIMVNSDMLNPLRYIDVEQANSTLSDREIRNILLEVSGIYETFYRALLSVASYLRSFSFVDDDFEYAQICLESIQRKLVPNQTNFENGLSEMQEGLRLWEKFA